MTARIRLCTFILCIFYVKLCTLHSTTHVLYNNLRLQVSNQLRHLQARDIASIIADTKAVNFRNKIVS